MCDRCEQRVSETVNHLEALANGEPVPEASSAPEGMNVTTIEVSEDENGMVTMVMPKQAFIAMAMVVTMSGQAALMPMPPGWDN